MRRKGLRYRSLEASGVTEAAATCQSHELNPALNVTKQATAELRIVIKKRMTSKAFRATLPSLNETQLARLQGWIAENCATGVVFQEHGCTVLLAIRERAKTQEAFLKSVRSTLKRLGIDMSQARRRWLSLTTEDAVSAEVAARKCGAQSPMAASIAASIAIGGIETADESSPDTPDDGDRIIALPGHAKRRGPAARSEPRT